jgi:5-methylthioadenosine/S-adenosylhomocysteine deaminase
VGRGAGFIYHCSEGQPGSVVAQEFTDAASAGCLSKTFIGIHCNAVPDADWVRWPSAAAGAVVWSPFSNLWLYGSTTNIPRASAQGVTICLGSDWGPSGTKHVLAEVKVARIVADAQHFPVSDRELVKMVTSSAGDVLARCWSRQIGRLVPGAFADVVVLRPSSSGSVWSQILHATERDVMLVVVSGRACYGDATLMTNAVGPPSDTLKVRATTKRLAIPDPEDPTKAWKWRDIVARLNRVRQDPAAALRRAEGRRRSFAGPMNAPDAPLELALDMPAGPSAVAGPPPRPADVVIPKLPTLVHDAAYFASIRGRGSHGGLLDGLARFYE